jgi:hypothetical protein
VDRSSPNSSRGPPRCKVCNCSFEPGSMMKLTERWEVGGGSPTRHECETAGESRFGTDLVRVLDGVGSGNAESAALDRLSAPTAYRYLKGRERPRGASVSSQPSKRRVDFVVIPGGAGLRRPPSTVEQRRDLPESLARLSPPSQFRQDAGVGDPGQPQVRLIDLSLEDEAQIRRRAR